jgi:hypothetical protein
MMHTTLVVSLNFKAHATKKKKRKKNKAAEFVEGRVCLRRGVSITPPLLVSS